MKRFFCHNSCWVLPWLTLALTIAAQNRKKPAPEDGLVLPPIAVDKKKAKENLQAPPKQVELPAGAMAETSRISFEIAPVSTRGLLSQQTREALRALLRGNRGATVVKLRAFVSGSGDLRRIGEIVGEVFTEKRQPMPTLSVIQVGALPHEGEQVLIESTEIERTQVNPNGLAFISGQSAEQLGLALDRVKTAVRAIGGTASDVLRVTCFVSSLEQESAALPRIQADFPQAATLAVQMQRGPAGPAAECEAVTRLHISPGVALKYVNPTELGSAQNYSQIALVGPGKVVFTGAQLGFGSQEEDVKLVFERVGRVLASFQTGFDRVAALSIYLVNLNLVQKIRDVRGVVYTGRELPASTLLPFQGLPSIDGSFALEITAITP